MSLWCVQIGRHRLRMLARAALGGLLAVAMFGCGRTAPEGFWEPTKDDTAGIKAAVEANKAYFRTGLAELAMKMCDTALPGTTRTILSKELQGNPYKSRFRLDSLQHLLDSHEFKYTFIAGLDTLGDETTCTVTMAETIPGKLRMHAWEKTDSVRVDTIKVGENEYIYLTRYSTAMTRSSTFIEKTINGASTDGCVLKKVNGTWQLWKMAGGGRFYAPGPNDAPYIDHFYLNSANNRVDTVSLRPDTLHYGIQRFFSVDTADHQLLTYAVGDRVAVSNLITNQGDAYDYLYFNGRRYEFKDTVKFDSVTPGIYRLSLEHIPATVLWETKGSYNATVWGVPIRIQ
jgi:hypothetical protein